MAVRAFSGTSWIRFGGINLNGAFSVAALVKLMDTTAPTGWQAVSTSADSSTHSQVSHYVRGTAGTPALAGRQLLDVTASATGNNGSANAITNPASWKILVITKAAGSSTPRMHMFPIGGAWTQEAADSSNGNPATQAGGKFYIGAYADPSTAALGDFCNMRLALYAVWNGTALSDAQVQALSSGLATSAWTGHAVAPTSVWQFTQASTATAVADLVGSNTQDAITGTSVVTTDDPAGWTFAGGSPAGSSAVSASGGGAATATGQRGGRGAVTATAGGTTTATGIAAIAGSTAVSCTGGGSTTTAGFRTSVASHDEVSAVPPFTQTVTGVTASAAGTTTASGVAGGSGSSAVASTGGGSATASGVRGSLATAACTAGGLTTSSGARGGITAISCTTGGAANSAGARGAAATASCTGGGTTTATGVAATAGSAAVACTGGGSTTAAATRASSGSVSCTGGGSGTAAGSNIAGPGGSVSCTGGGATTATAQRAATASLGCSGAGSLILVGFRSSSGQAIATGGGSARVGAIRVPIIYRTGHSGRILSGMAGRASHHT